MHEFFHPVSLEILMGNLFWWMKTLMIGHMIIGLGAAWKVADIAGGSIVVIFGLGTVGLAVSS